MFVLTVIAVFLSAAALSCGFREKIQDTLAVVTSMLILILYILAFSRSMRMIWVIALICTAADILYIVRTGKSKEFMRLFADPVIWAFILTVAAVAVMTSERIFTWWDDINYWSSDAKQLYYLNGFPGRYGNVSPEFGDYPPVTSIFKWLFLQISPSVYRESLQFAGYFALNAVFLLPLHAYYDKLRPLKGKASARIGEVLFFFALMLFPGVFDGFQFVGTPADVTMAIVYGTLLLAIWDRDGHSCFFYYGRIAVYVSILLLTKSVGVEWAVFALVFYLLFAKREKRIWVSVFTGGGFLMSWLLFCLVMRRVAKLTGAGLRMVTSGFSLPEDAAERLGYYVAGAFVIPLHSNRNLTLDLPMAAVLIAFFFVTGIMASKKQIDDAEKKRLRIFFLAGALVTYSVIFAAHMSIFRTEDQYLDVYAMALSISRYGCPFTLGSAMLLTGMIFDRAGRRDDIRLRIPVFAVTIVAILLTADYTGIYDHLAGYRQSLEHDMAVIDDTIGDDGRLILAAVSDREYWGRRVLVLRDGRKEHRVHDVYISKAASPVALVYDDLFIQGDTFESIRDKIESCHAHYVLAEDPDSEAGELFDALIGDGGEYRPYCVYGVEQTAQGIRLTETR